MNNKLSKKPLIICSDRVEEQVRLTTLLASNYDNLLTCHFGQLELMLSREPCAIVVAGWLSPCAELRVIIELCALKSHPLLVVLKQLKSNDMNRLPEAMDYVLLPADSQFSLEPWIEHASNLRNTVASYQQQISKLKHQIEDRKVIEKAKGLLMKIQQVDEDTAYQAMRKSAMQSSQSLAQVAKNLLHTLQAFK